MGLPGGLAQGNAEIDQLLIRSVLQAPEFHKNYYVNSKVLRKDYSITWKQAKEIIKSTMCSFYNQTMLPARTNPKGTLKRKSGRWMCSTL